MEHSFFSVIVPVCRCGKYTECLVKSLLRQSFGDFEVLILNDGSGNGTLDAYGRQAQGKGGNLGTQKFFSSCRNPYRIDSGCGSH